MVQGWGILFRILLWRGGREFCLGCDGAGTGNFVQDMMVQGRGILFRI